MTTRRRFLATVAGTTAAATVAGCLGMGDNDDEPADLKPGSDVETDDELLNSLADPSSQVPPRYFSGYQYRIGELRENFNPQETIPRIGGAVAGLFDGETEGLAVDDLDRITGSIYNAAASGGALQVQPLPSGQAVHATGDFSAAPILDLLDSSEAQQSFGSAEGYDRYMTEIRGGDGFEAWGVRDGRLIIVNRSDVTSRSEQYETLEDTAEDALALEFDQVERNDAPIADSAPAFVESVRDLEPGTARAGAAFALIPQGSDIGVEALDTVVNGVIGAGVSASLGADPTLQRSVSYLEAGMASVEVVRNAYEASETDEIPVDGWEFDRRDATITADTALDEQPSSAMLQTGLPVPGYESLFRRIDPNDLNRAPTPLVSFQPAIEDGQLRLRHTGGSSVESLRVRYVNDGDVQHESWDGTVSQGDEFTSDRTVDGGTQSWVTWRPDTVDAAVLIRFETPA
jgi:hypothetical protein